MNLRNLASTSIAALLAVAFAGCGGKGSSSALPDSAAQTKMQRASMTLHVTRDKAIVASGNGRKHLSIPSTTASIVVEAYAGKLPLPPTDTPFVTPNGTTRATITCVDFAVNQNTVTVTAEIPIGDATVVISAKSTSCANDVVSSGVLSQAVGVGVATAAGGDLGSSFFGTNTNQPIVLHDLPDGPILASFDAINRAIAVVKTLKPLPNGLLDQNEIIKKLQETDLFAEVKAASGESVVAKLANGAEFIVFNDVDFANQPRLQDKLTNVSGKRLVQSSLADQIDESNAIIGSSNIQVVNSFTEKYIQDQSPYLNITSSGSLSSLEALSNGEIGILILLGHGVIVDDAWYYNTNDIMPESIGLTESEFKAEEEKNPALKRLVDFNHLSDMRVGWNEGDPKNGHFIVGKNYFNSLHLRFSKNSIVFLDSCSSMEKESQSTIDFFHAAGARVVVGWTGIQDLDNIAEAAETFLDDIAIKNSGDDKSAITDVNDSTKLTPGETGVNLPAGTPPDAFGLGFALSKMDKYSSPFLHPFTILRASGSKPLPETVAANPDAETHFGINNPYDFRLSYYPLITDIRPLDYALDKTTNKYSVNLYAKGVFNYEPNAEIQFYLPNAFNALPCKGLTVSSRAVCTFSLDSDPTLFSGRIAHIIIKNHRSDGSIVSTPKIPYVMKFQSAPVVTQP